MDNFVIKKPKKKYTWLKRFFTILFFVVLIFSLFTLHEIYFKKPNSFQEKIFVVEQGSSLSKVLNDLSKDGLIDIYTSTLFLIKKKNFGIQSGPYRFKKAVTIYELLSRLHRGIYGDVYTSIRIPEGSNNKQIQEIILSKKLHNVKKDELESLMLGKEGYFFPDTYIFDVTVSAKDITALLEKTYKKKKTKAFTNKTINKSERELLIMASLIVKEANDGPEEKQMIADILWKRIARGQRLQVDAPFLYEYGPGVHVSQMRKKNSPFNTYLNGGLTPAPIGNPDYDSLYAAAHPKKNPYYFYLHGKNGQIYYARDYQGHLKNIRMYLR